MNILYLLLIVFAASVSVTAQEIVVEQFDSPEEYHEHYAGSDIAKKYIFQRKISKYDSELLFFNKNGKLIRTLEVIGRGPNDSFRTRVRITDNYVLIITQDYSIKREGGSPVKIVSQIFSSKGKELGVVEDEMQSLRFFSDSLFILSDYGIENIRETCSAYSRYGVFVKELPGFESYNYLAERNGLVLCYKNGHLTAMNKHIETLWSVPVYASGRVSISKLKQTTYFTGNVFVLDSLGNEIVKLNTSDKRSGGRLAALSDDGSYLFWAHSYPIMHKKTTNQKRPGVMGLFDMRTLKHLWVKKLAAVTFSPGINGLNFLGDLPVTRHYKDGLFIYGSEGAELEQLPMKEKQEEALIQMADHLLLFNHKTGVVKLVRQAIH